MIEALGRGYSERALNENLGPLRRFLERNVGRPWRKVHAEICARISVGSAVQKHVRDHLADFVREDVWEGEDGALVCAGHFGGVEPVVSRWRATFYVCPKTGLLRHSPQSRALAPGVRSLGDGRFLVRRGETTFLVRTVSQEQARTLGLARCAFTKVRVGVYRRTALTPWRTSDVAVEVIVPGKALLRTLHRQAEMFARTDKLRGRWG